MQIKTKDIIEKFIAWACIVAMALLIAFGLVSKARAGGVKGSELIAGPKIKTECINGLEYAVAYWEIKTNLACTPGKAKQPPICQKLETDDDVRAVSLVQVFIPGQKFTTQPPQPKRCGLDGDR